MKELDKLSLKDLALQINRYYCGSIENNYVALGKMLIVARDRVKADGLNWHERCEKNLFKNDGKPFKQKTIENYIYLAGDPERVEKQKAMQRKNIRNIRLKASSASAVDTINALFTKQTSDKDQCDIPMAIWEQVSEKAQEKFLRIIGARV